MSSSVSNRKKICKVEYGKLAPLKFNGMYIAINQIHMTLFNY